MAFPPPPRIDSLGAEVLSAISDDDLEYGLSSYVADRIAESRGEFDAIERLPPKLLTWYIAYMIDAEVLNGGFNQLFFNPSGKYAPDGPLALEEIGIPDAAGIVREALALYEQHAPALEAAAEAGTLEAFAATYLDQPFSDLDWRYSAQEEAWRLARLRYLRTNVATLGHP